MIAILALAGVYQIGPNDEFMPMIPALTVLIGKLSAHLFSEVTREDFAEYGDICGDYLYSIR